MTLDFYFDFSSPYGYIAAEKIDALAEMHGRQVVWKPFLIGAAFKQQGIEPPVMSPLKHAYFLRDFERTAAFHKVPYRHPSTFPLSSLVASRAFYAVERQAPALAKLFAQQCYRSYFTQNLDISALETVLDVAESLGLDRQHLASSIQLPEIKDTLRQVTEQALARGVFGSPFIFVDGEAFWGSDRLEQVERWLSNGPW